MILLQINTFFWKRSAHAPLYIGYFYAFTPFSPSSSFFVSISSQYKMYIFVSAPNERNEKVQIQCLPTDNIEELRVLIAKEFGREFPPKRQRLLFGGKQVI